MKIIIATYDNDLINYYIEYFRNEKKIEIFSLKDFDTKIKFEYNESETLQQNATKKGYYVYDLLLSEDKIDKNDFVLSDEFMIEGINTGFPGKETKKYIKCKPNKMIKKLQETEDLIYYWVSIAIISNCFLEINSNNIMKRVLLKPNMNITSNFQIDKHFKSVSDLNEDVRKKFLLKIKENHL